MIGLFSESFDVVTQRRKIIWIDFLIMDVLLSRITRTEILQHLTERGYDVYLFALHSKKRCHLDSGVHLISVPLRYFPMVTASFFALVVIVFLPFFVLAKRPHFVIVEPGPPIFGFMLWKPLLCSLKSKVVLDIRSTPTKVDNFRGYLNAAIFNMSVIVAKKTFDGATIITALMKRELCDKFRINPEFIGVWTSGVSTALFKPEKYSGIEMRRKLGLTNKFVIFYHGDLTVHRGIIESIKSIEILKSKCNDLVLFLLGSGPALHVLVETVRKKGIQDKVIIHNPVDYVEVPKYISMCDVGIVPLPNLPVWRHQSPLKLLEYLAMEKVVIVTDIPANREIVGNSGCGIYIASANPKEIARAIIHARNNRERLKEWGSYGRAITNEKYSWEKVAEDLDDYLLGLYEDSS